MVAAWAGAVENLEALLVAVRSFADEVFEGFGRDEARAGASHEHAAGGDDLHSENVEVIIFLQAFGFEFFVAAVDKFGRIAEDEVPGLTVLLHLANPAKSVRMHEFNARVVEVRVALGHFDGLFVEVDAGYFRGAGQLGGDGEAAGIAAEVEDLEALGQGTKAPAVIALVAEEARLVAFSEVDFLNHPELLDFDEAHG